MAASICFRDFTDMGAVGGVGVNVWWPCATVLHIARHVQKLDRSSGLW